MQTALTVFLVFKHVLGPPFA